MNEFSSFDMISMLLFFGSFVYLSSCLNILSIMKELTMIMFYSYSTLNNGKVPSSKIGHASRDFIWSIKPIKKTYKTDQQSLLRSSLVQSRTLEINKILILAKWTKIRLYLSFSDVNQIKISIRNLFWSKTKIRFLLILLQLRFLNHV